MKYNAEKLLDMAILARTNAYAPYSNFKVGAAILLNDGEYILGCNVENASYGLANCAERTAIFSCVARGYNKEDIIAMAIVGDTKKPISPCGACRQVMVELLPSNCPIILGNLNKDIKEVKLEELLPYSFDDGDL